MRTKLIAAALGIAVLAVAATGSAHRLPHAKRCPVFPKSNAWNQRVDKLPVAANSNAVVRAIGPGDPVHADFGSGLYQGAPIGIPYTTVSGHQHRVPDCCVKLAKPSGTCCGSAVPGAGRGACSGAVSQ